MEDRMAEPVIEIKGLGKSFKSKNGPVVALRDINLTVEKGDIFGIIGMSGAGKSTLLHLLGGAGITTAECNRCQKQEQNQISAQISLPASFVSTRVIPSV